MSRVARTPEVPSLEALALEISDAHTAATSALGSSLLHARRAGELLIQAKAMLEHGQWGEWLVANFPGSDRTARVYMRIAEQWGDLPVENGRALPFSIDQANKLLSTPRSVDGPLVPANTGVDFRRRLTAMHSAMDAFDPDVLTAKDLALLGDLVKRIRAFMSSLSVVRPEEPHGN